MANSVAPWLEGLSDAWEVPAGITGSQQVSSASHDATSLRSNSGSVSRIPKRSPSGLPSSLSSQKTSSNATTQIKRSPLAPLSQSNANTLRRPHGTVKLGARSVSDTSNNSLLQCGTVQQRAKSTSPTKQETLEWKKRLVNGQVGYGDQTELFGATGLENIFARSKGPEDEAPKPKHRMSWLQHKSDAPMPSSPPPWPNSFTDGSLSGAMQQSVLEPVGEEEYDDVDGPEEEDSFRSNPFDLRNTDELEEDRQSVVQQPESDEGDEEPAQRHEVTNRTVSGQTELSQEDFSPVFISKHTTVTGQVNYAALDSHLVKQFNSVEVHLRHPSQQEEQLENGEEDADVQQSGYDDDYEEQETTEQSEMADEPHSDNLPTVPDLSLSENLPTGTPPVASLGRNIELKRGGYSAYGSFKQRPLSPSPSKDVSKAEHSALPQESELLSPMPVQGRPLPAAPTPLNVRLTPLRPVTPDPPKSRSSGSPLKLFAAHDTFTSNRLLRRMSQLDPEGNPIKEEQPDVLRDTTPPAIENQRVVSNASSRTSFGNGELDSHAFNANVTITSASDTDEDQSQGSPGSEIAVPGATEPLRFRLEMSPGAQDTFKLKRKLSKQSAAKTSNNSTLEGPQKDISVNVTIQDGSELAAYFERAEQVKSYDGSKRPPTSPFKNPTPKRRRTLHASELEDELAHTNFACCADQREAMNSRKRTSARNGDSQNIADQDTLASRKILRPRNPTPSQRRKQQIESELREAAEEFAAQEPERLETVVEQIESSIAGSHGYPTIQQQAEAVAKEVANFTLRVQRPSGEHSQRKISLTTQDFMSEAVMVMQLIRSKARPQSGLGSVEESDVEGLSMSNSLRPDDSVRGPGESLRVSRPPSREGGHSGWRSGHQSQVDARVVSHLRRFQETNDTEFFAETAGSLHVEDEETVNDNVIVVDEETNIRIMPALPHLRRGHDESDESRPVSQRSQGSTLGTEQSAGMSTGRTIGTSSTRKSDNVGTLAPDAVAHLIGEQVGAMTFDKETQRWVRVKSPPKKTTTGFLEPPSQLTSDDDPFREISDLPVDDQNELRRISASSKTAKPTVDGDDTISVHDQQSEADTAHLQPSVESRTSSNETAIQRPVTRDSSHMQSRFHHMHSSSVPSRYTAFGSSQQEKVETRATSWSDEELTQTAAMRTAKQQPLAYAAAQATLALRGQRDSVAEEPEAEATEMTFPSPPNHRIPGQLNGFPQHTATTALKPTVGEELNDLPDDTVLHEDEATFGTISSPKQRRTPAKQPFAPPPIFRSAQRQMSLLKQTLTTRRNPEPREESELSFVAALPGDRVMSLSLSVSRPVATRYQSQVAEVQSSPSKADPNATFLWSDLNELTINEDEDRPSEQVLATRLAQYATAQTNDRYALAKQDLVKTLTDVQEDDPFWEHVRQLDLCGRAPASLYGLDEFCPRVQDLNVSENGLAQLEGAPIAVRRLFARFNQLSSLTCFDHLMNLQYLDISGNQLHDLHALSSLVHLRELCADDNQITSLTGIFELDGLLKLRLRRNHIQRIDFAGCQLQRLTSLDLSNNDIQDFAHLDELPVLKHLRLDGNPLKPGLCMQQCLPRLESLSVRSCGLEHLDVSLLPNVRKLEVDDNRLATIEGIPVLKQLELLSMRRQTLPEGAHITLFGNQIEARCIRLSRNTIQSLHMAHGFLNLQHLELASTGLQELPDDFGLRMPNLRTLNLNFNSLKDIRPLLNIQRLEQLGLCGNRLHRLRKSVAILAKLSSLKSLDLRDNPISKGFYPPVLSAAQTTMVRKTQYVLSEDEDALAETLEQAKHTLPRGDTDQDQQHQARMDEETKLRRRVYALLLSHSCASLQDLDGLHFDKAMANVKDKTWERLVALGVVRKSRNHSAELSEPGTG